MNYYNDNIVKLHDGIWRQASHISTIYRIINVTQTRRTNLTHCKRYFQIDFLVKELYFDFSLTEIVPKHPINNKPTMVQTMAWRRIDHKPLSEPMVTHFPDAYTHYFPIGNILKYRYSMLTCYSDTSIYYQYKYQNIIQWRHNEHDGVSIHQHHECLLSRLFRRRSKKTSKLRITGLCVGNSPVTGEFPAQRASYAEMFSWWRHHDYEHRACLVVFCCGLYAGRFHLYPPG